MAQIVEVSKKCENDLKMAFNWYEAKRENLGLRLLEDFSAFIHLVSTNPELGRNTYGNLRKFVLRNFPYVIYYTFKGETVRVLACLYGGQDPREIKSSLQTRNS